MIKTVYISGAVSGVKDYLDHFNEAEKLLVTAGFKVINPARAFKEASKSLPYDQLMDLCSALLLQCDAVHLLKGWNYSLGSKNEPKLAEENGIKTMFESSYEMDDEIIASIKRLYTKGVRIKLIQMANDPYPTKPGTFGTVNHVDDAGTIHMFWGTGSTLGLIPGFDEFEIVKEESNREL